MPDKIPDPWGRSPKKPEGPPDLDALLRKYKAKVLNSFSKKIPFSTLKGSSTPPPLSVFLTFIIGVLFFLWLLSGIFIVSPAERAVVLCLGRYVETLEPGPHWIPRFIESKKVLNVQRVSNFSYQSEMLTKDENIVSVAVAVQYRIKDARDFLFNVVDSNASLQQATASALRQAVGHNTLDDLLTTGRAQVREQVALQLQDILQSYKVGLLITDVTLQSIRPPEAVTAAFDDAIKAREDQQAYINQATAYANQALAAAQGRSSRIIQEAEAYRKEAVLEAKGSIAGYLALLPEYQKAPQITRERLYLSTIGSILAKTNKIFLDQKNGNPIFYLPLDKMTPSNFSQSMMLPSASTSLPAAKISTIVTASPEGIAANEMNMSRPDYPIRGDNP